MPYDDEYYVILNDLNWDGPSVAYGPTSIQRAALEFSGIVARPLDYVVPEVISASPDQVERAGYEAVNPIDSLQSDYRALPAH